MGLVISRKHGSSVWIGDALVTVKIERGVVRMEIEAPKNVPILRAELKEKAA